MMHVTTTKKLLKAIQILKLIFGFGKNSGHKKTEIIPKPKLSKKAKIEPEPKLKRNFGTFLITREQEMTTVGE